MGSYISETFLTCLIALVVFTHFPWKAYDQNRHAQGAVVLLGQFALCQILSAYFTDHARMIWLAIVDFGLVAYFAWSTIRTAALWSLICASCFTLAGMAHVGFWGAGDTKAYRLLLSGFLALAMLSLFTGHLSVVFRGKGAWIDGLVYRAFGRHWSRLSFSGASLHRDKGKAEAEG